jgi:hypothetical protein
MDFRAQVSDGPCDRLPSRKPVVLPVCLLGRGGYEAAVRTSLIVWFESKECIDREVTSMKRDNVALASFGASPHILLRWDQMGRFPQTISLIRLSLTPSLKPTGTWLELMKMTIRKAKFCLMRIGWLLYLCTRLPQAST